MPHGYSEGFALLMQEMWMVRQMDVLAVDNRMPEVCLANLTIQNLTIHMNNGRYRGGIDEAFSFH